MFFCLCLSHLNKPNIQKWSNTVSWKDIKTTERKKTKIQALDESYVFCFQQKADILLKNIKRGLEEEGLGDLVTKVIGDLEDKEEEIKNSEIKVKIREKFKSFDGKIYLPRFLYQEVAEEHFREVSYEMDILSRINWDEVSLIEFRNLSLSLEDREDVTINIGLSQNVSELIDPSYGTKTKSKLNIDKLLITRQIANLVPNPWVAHSFSNSVIEILKERYTDEEIANNQAYVAEELKKLIEKERDKLAENVFRNLIEEGKVKFLLEERKGRIPTKLTKVKRKAKKLIREDGEPIQKSLVEPVIEDDFNGLEKPVAVCLDTKEKLLWWYRNIARVDYSIQGWKKNKIYPDFLVTKKHKTKDNDYSTLYVLETKGDQLIGNLDTNYKQDVFKLCNELGRKTSWNVLGLEFSDRKFMFQVVPEDEWKKEINSIFD
ncbi:hypothetical protein [Bacillus coahuilensis]|uniref:hypothetical protein n=1 Tax=Bacillus coahuilensis TaxID=408580 RepID=UPI001F4C6D30|nr:hypothetical protein [Bacillus coahuilensis]